MGLKASLRVHLGITTKLDHVSWSEIRGLVSWGLGWCTFRGLEAGGSGGLEQAGVQGLGLAGGSGGLGLAGAQGLAGDT